MTPHDYIKSFEKYIDKIILPKYPEIEKFHIELGRDEWSREWQKFVPVIEITYYVDGLEHSLEFDMKDDMYNMKKLFSADKEQLFVDWRFSIDGSGNTMWERGYL